MIMKATLQISVHWKQTRLEWTLAKRTSGVPRLYLSQNSSYSQTWWLSLFLFLHIRGCHGNPSKRLRMFDWSKQPQFGLASSFYWHLLPHPNLRVMHKRWKDVTMLLLRHGGMSRPSGWFQGVPDPTPGTSVTLWSANADPLPPYLHLAQKRSLK